MSRYTKTIMIMVIFLIVTVMSVVVNTSIADDWPCFMGPHHNATSNEKGLLKTWSKAGPKVLWTVKLGAGFGSPSVMAGKVYILDRVKNKQDVLRCLDLRTGKELWNYAFNAPGRISYNGSRPTPTVSTKYVYGMCPFGDLLCIDKTTHKLVWHKNILKQFKGRRPIWAVSQAPVLYKNTVIVAPVTSQVGAVAYNKNTGKVVWTSKPLPGKLSYATAVITNIGGIDQAVVITTKGVGAVDASNGKILWFSTDWKCQIPITSPSIIAPGKIFVTGGYRAGAIMLQVKKTLRGFKVTTLFKTSKCNCQIHQPLLYKGYMYINGNDKSKRYGLICMDLQGKLRWQTGRNPGFDWGGLILADGMIYSIDGNTGDLCLIKPDPTGYKEIARAKMLSGPQIWAPIVLSDGKLLIRDQKQMKCVDIKGP